MLRFGVIPQQKDVLLPEIRKIFNRNIFTQVVCQKEYHIVSQPILESSCIDLVVKAYDHTQQPCISALATVGLHFCLLHMTVKPEIIAYLLQDIISLSSA